MITKSHAIRAYSIHYITTGWTDQQKFDSRWLVDTEYKVKVAIILLIFILLNNLKDKRITKNLLNNLCTDFRQ